MKVVDFAEMLGDSIEEIEEKINQCRGDMHESYNPIYNNSLAVEIEELEWVQEQTRRLVLNKNKNTSNK
jgi:TATA-binding protein-associated factor Taf7